MNKHIILVALVFAAVTIYLSQKKKEESYCSACGK